MTGRSTVFLLWHSTDPEFIYADPELLGVYSTNEAAKERQLSAVELPGFRLTPYFQISEYEIDRDEWTEGLDETNMAERRGFGCPFCTDDNNRLYGHVHQIASNDATKLILLCCPRCGALYENVPRGKDQTRRLTITEAREGFPEARI